MLQFHLISAGDEQIALITCQLGKLKREITLTLCTPLRASLAFQYSIKLVVFVKICVSSFCPTSVVPLLLTYRLGAAVSLQCCHPLEQEPSLCLFCSQEEDFCITENLTASHVVCAAVLNPHVAAPLLHQEQQ